MSPLAASAADNQTATFNALLPVTEVVRNRLYKAPQASRVKQRVEFALKDDGSVIVDRSTRKNISATSSQDIPCKTMLSMAVGDGNARMVEVLLGFDSPWKRDTFGSLPIHDAVLLSGRWILIYFYVYA